VGLQATADHLVGDSLHDGVVSLDQLAHGAVVGIPNSFD
jgi:hypothetical protein